MSREQTAIEVAIASIVACMEDLTEPMSTANYCEVLQGVIDEFQPRLEVAQQEASAS